MIKEKLLASLITVLIILLITLIGRIVRWIIERKDHKQDHNTSGVTVWDVIDKDSNVMRMISYFALGCGVVIILPLLVFGLIEVVECMSNMF